MSSMRERRRMLNMPLNESSMTFESDYNGMRELYDYKANSLGTYVKTTFGWLYICVNDYVSDAGIDYYKRRTENLYEELLSRGCEEEQQPMERDKIGYGEIAFKSKSIKKTTFAMVATISSVIIFRYF